jgi:hypothetical protein
MANAGSTIGSRWLPGSIAGAWRRRALGRHRCAETDPSRVRRQQPVPRVQRGQKLQQTRAKRRLWRWARAVGASGVPGSKRRMSLSPVEVGVNFVRFASRSAKTQSERPAHIGFAWSAYCSQRQFAVDGALFAGEPSAALQDT